nr:MAG TPA: hypothetical protein [Caudoviricetes sp.]
MLSYVITKKKSRELFVISVSDDGSEITFSTPGGKEVKTDIEDFISTLLESFPLNAFGKTFGEYKEEVVGYRVSYRALQVAVRLGEETARSIRVGKIIVGEDMDSVIIGNGDSIHFNEAAHFVMAAVAMRKLKNVESISDVFSYEHTVEGSRCALWEDTEINKGNGWYRI